MESGGEISQVPTSRKPTQPLILPPNPTKPLEWIEQICLLRVTMRWGQVHGGGRGTLHALGDGGACAWLNPQYTLSKGDGPVPPL